jgi:hypothetical protein
MPFGLEYVGPFDYYSQGWLWVIYSLTYSFLFAYLSSREQDNALIESIGITIYTFLFNCAFILFHLPLMATVILTIIAYIVVTKCISSLNLRQVLKIILMITITFSIGLMIPDVWQLVYTLLLFLYLYLQSEKRMKANPAALR